MKKSTIAITLSLGLLLIFSTSIFAAVAFSRTADNGLTSGRALHRGFVNIGGLFYAFGGGNTAGTCNASTCSAATAIYDPDTDSWSAGGSMPDEGFFKNHRYAANDTHIFALANDSTCCDQYVYSVTGDTWAASSPTPATNMALACSGESNSGDCIVEIMDNGFVYVLSSNGTDAAAGSCDGLSTDGWIAAAEMSQVVLNLTSVVWNCSIHSDLSDVVFQYTYAASDGTNLYFNATDSGTEYLYKFNTFTGNVTQLAETPGQIIMAFDTSLGAFFGVASTPNDFENIAIYQVIDDELTFIQAISDTEYGYLAPTDTDCLGFVASAIDNASTTVIFGSGIGNTSCGVTANRWWIGEGVLGLIIPPDIGDYIQGWATFLGTSLFISIVTISIFVIHLKWNIPFEMLYPFGLIIGAILSHPSIALLEPWWIIAAGALIGALYLYKLLFQGNGEMTQ